MQKSWWQRNRLWLALGIPLLALAVLASSFRLLTLYLPWQWSAPTHAHSAEGTLRQKYLELDGVTRDREVTVRVVSLEPQESADGLVAVDGATLWRVDLELTAEPDQFLELCHVELADVDGNRYDFASGLIPATSGDYIPAPVAITCVPEDAPGPTVSLFTDEIVESPIPRPDSWNIHVLFAVPTGVTPTEVRVGWQQPEHLVLLPPGRSA